MFTSFLPQLGPVARPGPSVKIRNGSTAKPALNVAPAYLHMRRLRMDAVCHANLVWPQTHKCTLLTRNAHNILKMLQF